MDSTHESVALEGEAAVLETLLPTVLSADSGIVIQKTLRFLVSGEAGELATEWMIGKHKKLFSVQNRRIPRRTITALPNPKGL